MECMHQTHQHSTNIEDHGRKIFSGPVGIFGGYIRSPAKFFAAATTPSVENQEFWIANNTGAVTITNFLNGYVCQVIRILGDGFTTIANNANIKTNTGANKLLAVNKVYVFTFINNLWVEDA